MLGTLQFKQKLSDTVLDGQEDWAELEQPSARSKFMERLSEVLKTDFAAAGKDGAVEESQKAETGSAGTPALPPVELFRQEAGVAFEGKLRLCKISPEGDGTHVGQILAVTSKPREARPLIDSVLEKSGHAANAVDATILTPEQYRMLQDLAVKGLIVFNDKAMQTVIETESITPPEKDNREKRRIAAEPHLKKAQRTLRMAAVLEQGDFPVEAAESARKALDQIAPALDILAAEVLPELPVSEFAQLEVDALLRAGSIEPAEATFLRGAATPPAGESEAAAYLGEVRKIAEQTEAALLRLAL